jgi:hypothetical protein
MWEYGLGQGGTCPSHIKKEGRAKVYFYPHFFVVAKLQTKLHFVL